MRQPLPTAKPFFALYSLVVFLCSVLFAQSIYSQVDVNTPWIWKKGPKEPYGTANNGSIGVEAASNLPTPRSSGSTFTDINGNLWLFGGFTYQPAPAYHYFNDLWKFNPTTNNWTWMKGNSAPNTPGNYGTKGVVAATNNPGARSDAASWVDKNGNLWLFGGDGMDRFSFDGKLNDLWKFDVATNNWVWISGNDYANATGNYGVQGVPSTSNLPPARSSLASWTDDLGNLWLYGGYDNEWDFKNDLWRYNIATNTWTWMNGSSATNLPPDHGTLGIATATNTPGGRAHSTSWIDGSNNLYLFGGSSINTSYNDLWKYNPQTNQWTWIHGNNLPLQPAVMGTQGVPHPQNKPGARMSASAFTDMQGNFWLFGGWGVLSVSTLGALNDLWKYTPATNQWTWMKEGQLNALGVYGTQGQAAFTNKPGSKWLAMSWSSPAANSFWLFGGLGFGETLGWGEMNDLWNLNSSSVITSIAAPTTPLSKFTIYPNPASTHISFTLPGAPVFKIAYNIIDASGRTALQGQLTPITTNKFSIEISSLPPGQYIVIINTKQGAKQAPFIKQ